jgi:putative DNA primase/helicase
LVYGQELLAEAAKVGEADWHEGESDCWTSWYYRRFAFSVPGAGAAKAISRDHVRDLRVINLFVQSDQSGENFRELVLTRLRELEFVGIMRIVRMPGGIKDLNELHQRHLGDPGGFEVALKAQLESAEIIDLASFVSFGSSWGVPLPIPGCLPPVPQFDMRLLPNAFGPWVADIAERSQCPAEYVAVASITSIAAIIGRKVGICPKRADDWLVVPNLWGLVVGTPGVLKTPALAEGLQPVHRLALAARDQYARACADHEFDMAVERAHRDELEKAIKFAIKSGKSVTELADLKEKFAAMTSSAPLTERRYIVNDTTVEKLGELLNQNANGLLLYRDEISGFLLSMDRQGHENDRPFYLECWNGSGAYTYDRIGRGTLHIEAACLSLIGGIQPGPLQAYLHETFSGRQADGLIQRFQLAVYPDPPTSWTNVDRAPDIVAKNFIFSVFERLDALDAVAIGSKQIEGEIPFLRFAADAQAIFDEWRADLERKLRTDDEHPVLVAHLAKYRSLMPSLALLFHLTDLVATHDSETMVSRMAAQKAAAWCDFLEAHARRIYQSVTARGQFAATLLAKKIRGGKVPNPFTARQIYRNQWTGLSELDDIDRAVDLLEELNWLKIEAITHQQGGRPTKTLSHQPELF